MSKLTQVPASDYLCRPTDRSELKFEQGAYGQRFRTGASDQQSSYVSPGNEHAFKPQVMLEVIWFSKIHLVTADEYVARAKDYHQILRNEALTLLGSLTDNQKIYNEWVNPKWWTIDSAVSHSVSGTSAVIGWFKEVKRAPKPDPGEFDKLISRVNAVAETISQAASTLLYVDIHNIGVELALIRADSNVLYRQIEKFRGRAIDVAEGMTHGIETVESASFQLLTIVPTITMMDPLREAAYRIGLVILRAGARSLGSVLADTSIVDEVCGVLWSDVPPLIVDVATSGLNKYLNGIKVPVLQREFCIFIIQQHIEFLCDLVKLVHSKGSNVNADDFKQIGMDRLASCFATLLSKVLGGHPTDPGVRKMAKSLAESTLNTVFRDAMTARDTAKNTKQDFWKVFLSDLPWTIVKIIQGTFVGVMHRNAASIAHQASDAGTTGQDEGAEILKNQKASSIFNGKFEPPEGAPVKNPRPLPPMTLDQYRELAKEDGEGGLNLHPDMTGPLRRYTHDADQFVAFRIPSRAMKAYLAEYAMWPKPVWLKAKTARFTNNEGKVVKPSAETHGAENLEDAMALWKKSADGIKKQGAMVNEDGVVFHPDMLKYWARSNPEDREAAENAYALLTQVQPGNFDLSTADGQLLLSVNPEVQSLLRRVRIGYYSDLDLAEVLDASTGEAVALGAGNEEDSEELAYLQENRNNIDKAINVNDDLKNIPVEFRAPDGNPRVSADRKTPHALSVIQHGGNEQFHGGPIDGPIGQSRPNGIWRRYNNRAEYRAEMKAIFGDKYQKSNVRGQQLAKNSLDDPTHSAKASGNGEKIRTNKIARMQWYYQSAVRDVDGAGQPVSPNAIAASLFHRGLTQQEPAYQKLDRSRMAGLPDLQRRNQVLIAGDLDGENLVLAAQTNESIAEALARLARIAKHLRLHQVAGLTIWYEVYSRFKPVTSNYILNRVGGPDPGVRPAFDDVTDIVNSFEKKKRIELYAFCLDGFVNTYSPPLKYYGAHGRTSLNDRDAKQRDKEIRDDMVASLGVKAGEYGKMWGQKLTNVWDPKPSRELSYTPTEIAGRQVVFLTAGMAACPSNIVPRELTELTHQALSMSIS